MTTRVQIKFEPYYYYPDGLNLTINAGAFHLYDGNKTIGSADTLEQAEAIKARYLKDMDEHSRLN